MGEPGSKNEGRWGCRCRCIARLVAYTCALNARAALRGDKRVIARLGWSAGSDSRAPAPAYPWNGLSVITAIRRARAHRPNQQMADPGTRQPGNPATRQPSPRPPAFPRLFPDAGLCARISSSPARRTERAD
jgi:hypothetical protein